ncbi:hypothetical protein NYE80_14385 [Paenibacillus sp. FSL H7-0357]|jgi:hypothetical protein|nr:hypothetical protein [Paenibacillus sp. FSL H7-0357]
MRTIADFQTSLAADISVLRVESYIEALVNTARVRMMCSAFERILKGK